MMIFNMKNKRVLFLLFLLFFILFPSFSNSDDKGKPLRFNEDDVYTFESFRTEEQLIMKEDLINSLQRRANFWNIYTGVSLGFGIASALTATTLLTLGDLGVLNSEDVNIYVQIGIWSGIAGLASAVVGWRFNVHTVKKYFIAVDEYINYRRQVKQQF